MSLFLFSSVTIQQIFYFQFEKIARTVYLSVSKEKIASLLN